MPTNVVAHPRADWAPFDAARHLLVSFRPLVWDVRSVLIERRIGSETVHEGFAFIQVGIDQVLTNLPRDRR